uniref:Uncharacterized protein n=1 Tax=Siphoviridae sp. ctLqe90 TaxID=2825456 RepID=A0A8S5Q3G2_9CAUD|nr:MAG TPA: hypothetical protein [Siphoviridae sp. ctLqe90]
MCDIINEYYGFSVFVRKVDSIISINPKKN